MAPLSSSPSSSTSRVSNLVVDPHVQFVGLSWRSYAIILSLKGTVNDCMCMEAEACATFHLLLFPLVWHKNKSILFYFRSIRSHFVPLFASVLALVILLVSL